MPGNPALCRGTRQAIAEVSRIFRGSLSASPGGHTHGTGGQHATRMSRTDSCMAASAPGSMAAPGEPRSLDPFSTVPTLSLRHPLGVAGSPA